MVRNVHPNTFHACGVVPLLVGTLSMLEKAGAGRYEIRGVSYGHRNISLTVHDAKAARLVKVVYLQQDVSSGAGLATIARVLREQRTVVLLKAALYLLRRS